MVAQAIPPVAQKGGPYRPTVWSLGGMPEKNVDIPITSVFLALFIIGAAIHMIIYQKNMRRGHKFIFSLVIFGFCMARIVTCTLRIASISLPTNLSLAIAAQVFVAAGVLLLYIINLLWTQRIIRSIHPKIGWHTITRLTLQTLYILIGLTLAIVITATVQSFYTLRPRTKTIDRGLQLYAGTFLAIVATLPLPIVLLAIALPHQIPHDRFGTGRFRTKVSVLLTGTFLLALGAWYRCGTSWKHPVPRMRPLPDYYHKAAFYVFNFVVEILTVYLYAVLRVDLRFHVPDGARGEGSYSEQKAADVKDNEKVEGGQEECGDGERKENETV